MQVRHIVPGTNGELRSCSNATLVYTVAKLETDRCISEAEILPVFNPMLSKQLLGSSNSIRATSLENHNPNSEAAKAI